MYHTHPILHPGPMPTVVCESITLSAHQQLLRGFRKQMILKLNDMKYTYLNIFIIYPKLEEFI